MELGSYKIPVFSENPADFQQWKFKFINLIELRKLSHMIDESEPTLCPPILEKNANAEDKNAWEKQHGEAYRKWKEHSEEIFHLLAICCGRNISRSIYEQIRDYDGTKAWKMLLTRYERSDNLRVINYIRELTHLRYVEDGNLDIYLNNVDRLVKLIRNTAGDEAIPDILKVGFICAGLPDSMLDWISNRTSVESNEIDDILKDLREYVGQEILIQKDSTAGVFLAEKKSIASKKPPFRGKFKPKKRFCQKCKATTHNTHYHDKYFQAQTPSTHIVLPYDD